MTILNVGSAYQYKTIQSAINAAHSGDTIRIASGTYAAFSDTTKSLSLVAMKLPTAIASPNVIVSGAVNDKGAADVGGPNLAITMRGMEFTGASSSDGNGAGVRYEGGSLVLIDDLMVHNQEGVLSNPDPNGHIAIEDSEVAFNGTASGQTHNIYIAKIAQFTLTNSYVHDANTGHEVKSRALNNLITNDRIQDQQGTASYSIDLPNGGNATISNDTIQQGRNSENPIFISYGEEGGAYPASSLKISNNTVINNLTSHASTFLQNDTKTVASLIGNGLFGVQKTLQGPGTLLNEKILSIAQALITTHPW
jgi:hypothetical protein